jgi:hypothetical protein
MATATKKKEINYELEDTAQSQVKRLTREEILEGESVSKNAVARIDVKAGIVEMVPEYASYRVAVANWCNDNGVKYREFCKIGTELQPKSAPPKPKKNGRFGMKTPALVEWYAKHNRDAFLAKYQVKELQERVGWDEQETEIRDEKTGQKVPFTIRTPVYESVEGLDYDLDKLKRGESYFLDGKKLFAGEQRLIADCQTHLTTKLKDQGGADEYDWD